MPRLLVSVRSLAEARAAAGGGADIIDVKEPAQGPLGRADPQILDDILSELRGDSSDIPVSAALGEVTDLGRVPAVQLPRGLTVAKLGLSGLRHNHNWAAHWLETRRAFMHRCEAPLRWVAVAYADAEEALAPPAAEVLEAAVQTACAGLLIDTFDKAGGCLFDHIPVDTLATLAAETRERGLFFAAAGRLRIDDVPILEPVRPDIIAVRSAACEHRDRQGRVCSRLVGTLRQKIAATFAPPEKGPMPKCLTANR